MFGVNVKTPKTYDKEKAPKSYVPGMGRGAMGFMTHMEKGPAHQVPGANSKPPPGYIAGAGRGATGLADTKKETASDRNRDMTQFDQFSGYNEQLFGDAPYEADDEEADRIYANVDARLEERRKRARENHSAGIDGRPAKRARGERPRIADQFADLKQELASMQASDWESIPDESGSRARRRPEAKEGFIPTPDSVLIQGTQAAAASGGQGNIATSIHAGTETTVSGTATSGGAGISRAREQALSARLDNASDSVTGQTVVNPQGYLTSMQAHAGMEGSADQEKARLLAKSLVRADPSDPDKWIFAARVEEHNAKLAAARKLIQRGCEACPDSENVWMEAVRLATPQQAHVVIAEAVAAVPLSVKLWLRAAEMEPKTDAKRAVLQAAVDRNPTSETLWKAAVELLNEEDARVFLAGAVECVPTSVDLWLALARLEPYEKARKVLNRARQSVPTDPSIWVAASQLEEANGQEDRLDAIVRKAVRTLAAHEAVIERGAWLDFARKSESVGSPLTAAAIVRCCIGLGVEPEDRERTWKADATVFEREGYYVCARAAFAHLLQRHPDRPQIWRRAAELEQAHGSSQALEAVLRDAVRHCPGSPFLWLMAAKHKWQQGDIPGAREILSESFLHNPASEDVWLAAVKLEWETGAIDIARSLLARARAQAPTARIWMKSALLEREQGHSGATQEILQEGLLEFPTFDKLWLMLGQHLEASRRQDRARESYQSALRHCPSSAALWLQAARLAERQEGVARARSILERARRQVPKSETLWLESIRLEFRGGRPALGEGLLAKALQDVPEGGLLWAERIRQTPRAEKKGVLHHALTRLDKDPYVMLEAARWFTEDRKYDKARKWYEGAVTSNPDLGDVWAAYWQFAKGHGDDDEVKNVRQRCEAADPRHGDLWPAIRKDPARKNDSIETLLSATAAAFPQRG